MLVLPLFLLFPMLILFQFLWLLLFLPLSILSVLLLYGARAIGFGEHKIIVDLAVIIVDKLPD